MLLSSTSCSEARRRGLRPEADERLGERFPAVEDRLGEAAAAAEMEAGFRGELGVPAVDGRFGDAARFEVELPGRRPFDDERRRIWRDW